MCVVCILFENLLFPSSKEGNPLLTRASFTSGVSWYLILHSFAFFSSGGILLSAQQASSFCVHFFALFFLSGFLCYTHNNYTWPWFKFPHYYFPRVSLISFVPFIRNTHTLLISLLQASFLISTQLSSHSPTFLFQSFSFSDLYHLPLLLSLSNW